MTYSKQEIDQDDIDAVNRTLKSDYLTQGPLVSEFEKALAIKLKLNLALHSIVQLVPFTLLVQCWEQKEAIMSGHQRLRLHLQQM